MKNEKMHPVKEDRAYIKGRGTCVNVDNQSFSARKNKIQAERQKNERITSLENELSSIKDILNQILEKV